VAGGIAGRFGKERKGHPVKVKLAQGLRHETTMSLKWIAENLSMGTWTNVSKPRRSTANQTNEQKL